jgi:hypothetical protein
MRTPFATTVARNHRSHAGPKSGDTKHRDVNEQEKNQKIRNEEVNGSRRLLTAKDSDD